MVSKSVTELKKILKNELDGPVNEYLVKKELNKPISVDFKKKSEKVCENRDYRDRFIGYYQKDIPSLEQKISRKTKEYIPNSIKTDITKRFIEYIETNDMNSSQGNYTIKVTYVQDSDDLLINYLDSQIIIIAIENLIEIPDEIEKCVYLYYLKFCTDIKQFFDLTIDTIFQKLYEYSQWGNLPNFFDVFYGIIMVLKSNYPEQIVGKQVSIEEIRMELIKNIDNFEQTENFGQLFYEMFGYNEMKISNELHLKFYTEYVKTQNFRKFIFYILNNEIEIEDEIPEEEKDLINFYSICFDVLKQNLNRLDDLNDCYFNYSSIFNDLYFFIALHFVFNFLVDEDNVLYFSDDLIETIYDKFIDLIDVGFINNDNAWFENIKNYKDEILRDFFLMEI